MSKLIPLCLCALLMVGCAATNPYNQGRKLLKDGRYSEAIQTFEKILEENPNDARVLREIGIAHYKQRDYPKAIDYLNRVLEKNPGDGGANLYLGLTYEQQKNYDAAIRAYRNYTQVGSLSRMRRKIEARLSVLIDQRMTQLAAAALAEEAAGEYPDIQPNAVAVMYFDNTTNDADLDPLRKGLTDLLITDLSKVKALTIVERTRMQKLLEEMELADAAVVDEETAPRTGRLLGAAKVVKGSFTALAEESLLLNANFSDIQTREIKAAESLQGPLEELFDMEKKLVFDVLDEMQISISPEEEEAIQERPTENLLAFLAYSRGLDHTDRGDYQAAAEVFQEAAELDPGFTEAQESQAEAQEITNTPALTSTDPEVAIAEVETVAEAEEEVAAVEAVATAEEETTETEEEEVAETEAEATTEEEAAAVEAVTAAEEEFVVGDTAVLVEARPLMEAINTGVSKDFIPQPAAAARAPTAASEPQTRGGGSDQTTTDPSTGRTVSVTIIWKP